MPNYAPLPTGGRLHLKLGYVTGGNMTAGSNQLTGLGIPLLASDVNTQVSVMGAGPSAATTWYAGGTASPYQEAPNPPPWFVATPQLPAWPTNIAAGGPTLPYSGSDPPYDAHGHSFYPGTMLVAECTVISGNTMTLSASASNATQPGANNVTIYREVSTDINNPMKVQWTLTTTSRGTLTATIYDPTGSLNVQVGMPVLLYDDGQGWEAGDYPQGPYFGGSIDTVKARNIPGKVPWVGGVVGANPVYWDIQCVSWSHLLDKRLINLGIPNLAPNTGNPLAAPTPDYANDKNYVDAGAYGTTSPGQFINMYAGDIVNQLIYHYCDSDGLSTNLGDGEGVFLKFFQANVSKDTVAQAIDNVVQASTQSGVATSYIWWVDAWRKVYFVSAEETTAPWNVDETGASGDDASVLLSVSLETTREKLANSVYIDASQTITGIRNDGPYPGDPTKHSYSTGQAVGGAPEIWFTSPVTGLLGVSVPQPAQIFTVGVKGSPVQTADWYWGFGDNSIEQEVYSTIKAGWNMNASTTDLYIEPIPNTGNSQGGLRFSIDNDVYPENGPDSDRRKYIMIDNEWMRVQSGSLTTHWTVMRNCVLRRQASPSNGGQPHAAGSQIYPAALANGNQGGEQLFVRYPPIQKDMFPYSNPNGVDARSAVEGGSGIWDTQISLGYPFYDPIGGPSGIGAQLAQNFTDDYGTPPQTFVAETYRQGLALGQLIYIHMLRPPIHDPSDSTKGLWFLIDQLDFTTENKRQKWTFHAVNGTLIGDWRKAFIGLSNQFSPLGGAGNSTLAAAPGLPNAPGQPGVWSPGYVTPIAGDPLVTTDGFSVAPNFNVDGGGLMPQTQITATGYPQKDSNGNIVMPAIPVLFKSRREFVAGTVGSECIIGSTHNLIELPADLSSGVPISSEQFRWRIMSKVANVYPSTDPVPMQDFVITGHDQFGAFTVTPDPLACVPPPQTGDVFVIRTGRVATDPSTGQPVTGGANDASSTHNTFTDPTWNNYYNTQNGGDGLIHNGNVGNMALIIGGTGVGTEPRLVLSNDGTTITVDADWVIPPDATSSVVLLDTTFQQATAPVVSSLITGKIQVPNLNGEVVRVEGYLDPQEIQEGLVQSASWREIYLWGAQNTRTVDAGNVALGMYKTDRVLICDTSGVTAPPTLKLAADITATDTQLSLAGADGVTPANYTPPDGTMIRINQEYMLVTSGSGTPSVTVTRGWQGTTAVAVSQNADIVIGGEMTLPLIYFSTVPGQPFIFQRQWWNDDCNYVRLVPSANDVYPNELPNGELFHLLVDGSANYGGYRLDIPAQPSYVPTSLFRRQR